MRIVLPLCFGRSKPMEAGSPDLQAGAVARFSAHEGLACGGGLEAGIRGQTVEASEPVKLTAGLDLCNLDGQTVHDGGEMMSPRDVVDRATMRSASALASDIATVES